VRREAVPQPCPPATFRMAMPAVRIVVVAMAVVVVMFVLVPMLKAVVMLMVVLVVMVVVMFMVVLMLKAVVVPVVMLMLFVMVMPVIVARAIVLGLIMECHVIMAAFVIVVCIWHAVIIARSPAHLISTAEPYPECLLSRQI